LTEQELDSHRTGNVNTVVFERIRIQEGDHTRREQDGGELLELKKQRDGGHQRWGERFLPRVP